VRARRLRKERPEAPLQGFKLACPMVSADRGRGGFGGVTIGRATVYGVVASAECAQGAQHRSPARWCDCGFYCVYGSGEALDLTCDPDYRGTVLLEVAVSGRFVRYERGLRYERQRVNEVWAGRCLCGQPGTAFAETGAGRPGWRQLRPVCSARCAAGQGTITLSGFAGLLGGPPVRPGVPEADGAAGVDGADMARRVAGRRGHRCAGAAAVRGGRAFAGQAGRGAAAAGPADLGQLSGAGRAPRGIGEPARRAGQNLDRIEMNLAEVEPMPVRLSKPGPVVVVTSRVSQLPVASQKVSGPA
jgi:hypothetical protein